MTMEKYGVEDRFVQQQKELDEILKEIHTLNSVMEKTAEMRQLLGRLQDRQSELLASLRHH